MDEFLKLILTGERLQKLKRFNLCNTISVFAEIVCALSLLFLATPSVHASVSILSGVLILFFGGLSTAFNVKLAKLSNTLVNEQIFADANDNCDESEARKSLAGKYTALYAGKSKAFAYLGIIPVIAYTIASIVSVLINLNVTDASYVVPVLFVLSTASAIVIAIVPAVKNSNDRTRLYETADKEITFLKRHAGLDDDKIRKQAYGAKNTATHPQELFLCDSADRDELRKIFSQSGYCSLAFGIALICVISVLGLTGGFDGTFMAVSMSCLMLVTLIAWIALGVWMDLRRRVVYKRNALKLTDSEADVIRKYLQNEFIKFQRNGNIFFSLFCGIPALTGVILGAVGAVKDPEVSFVENVLGLTVVFFLISAVFAIIIWAVIYAFYRKKVKPAEMKLKEMGENYGKTDKTR